MSLDLIVFILYLSVLAMMVRMVNTFPKIAKTEITVVQTDDPFTIPEEEHPSDTQEVSFEESFEEENSSPIDDEVVLRRRLQRTKEILGY